MKKEKKKSRFANKTNFVAGKEIAGKFLFQGVQ
jgi:hypothetical protein